MSHRIKLTGNLKSYLRWPIMLSLLLVAASVHMYYISRRAGLYLALYTLVYIAIALLLWLSGRKKLQHDLVCFAQSYGKLQMKMMKEMSIPFAVLNTEGHLLWGNDDFLKIIVNKKAARRNISNIFPEAVLEKLPEEGGEDVSIRVTHDDQHFRAVMRHIKAGSVENPGNEGIQRVEMDQLIEDQSIIVMFLYDETEMVELEKNIESEKTIVGLLYIDNYEEMLDNVDEVRQSLVSALVDRKINKYMQGIDAISKKLEKDKFIFVFKQKYLKEMRDSRFQILEDIRTINVGNEQICTVSIGIGAAAATYAEQYNNARAAIDLALARGGDQAVVKAGENEEFYGGKRVSMEKNTRVKARVKAHALKEQIEMKEKVVVMGHSNGDTDSFGSSVGVYRIAKTLGRKAYVVLDNCTPSVKPLRDRFFTGDYEEDTIVDRDRAAELIDENTLLVVVDVNRANFTECPELIEKAKTVVVIDHHRKSGDAIDSLWDYVDPNASSASEMVAEMCQYIDSNLKLKPAESEALYAGIMIDTNYFTDKTGSRTFEAMAYLRRNGVDAIRLRKAFREDMTEYRIKAGAIQATTLYLNSFAIAESKPPAEVEAPTVLAAKIANELLNIQGVKASFVLTEIDNGRVHISARAIDEVNVQVMMERLGGGGHINMAGAQVKDSSVDEVKEKLRKMIDEMIKTGEIKFEMQ